MQCWVRVRFWIIFGNIYIRHRSIIWYPIDWMRQRYCSGKQKRKSLQFQMKPGLIMLIIFANYSKNTIILHRLNIEKNRNYIVGNISGCTEKNRCTALWLSCQFQSELSYQAEYPGGHGCTDAEMIYERADADKPFMGLTTFSGDFPTAKDIRIALKS